MSRETAKTLEFILEAPLGFYKRADMLLRLLTAENVGEVIAFLPAPFRSEFLEFARDTYRAGGAPVTVAGAPLPAASLEAIRGWLASEATVTPLQAAFSRLAGTLELLERGAVPQAPRDLALDEVDEGRGMPRQARCT